VDIIFISDSTELKKKLKSKKLDCLPSSQLSKTIRKADAAVLVYVDPGSAKIKVDSVLTMAGKNENVLLGIIDPKGRTRNIMDLIHKGIVDYIDAKGIPRDLTPSHFKRIINYVKKYRIESSLLFHEQRLREADGSGYIPVLHGWNDVKIGQEYTFSIMFIELDDREEMQNRYGMKSLAKALAVFKTYIEKNVLAFGGKIWMWSNFGGIALFPFNGSDCNAILCGFKMVMGKFLHDAEESHFPNFISFRIALHLGNVYYQEKRKGEVISDSLNTVFHLGQKFAEPGHFYLTEDIFKYRIDALQPYFYETNSYENRIIYKMRNPVI
jgi:hypothetical protein